VRFREERAATGAGARGARGEGAGGKGGGGRRREEKGGATRGFLRWKQQTNKVGV